MIEVPTLESADPELAKLSFAARGVLPAHVELECCRIGTYTGQVCPQEASFIRDAVQKRRREFAAGRQCARAALARLGIPPVPIPVGPHRAPVWPPSVVASITHDGDFCLAVAARSHDLAGIGIDLTDPGDLSAELVDMICVRRERDALAHANDSGRLFKTIFCIKESVYKCLFPIVRRYFDFHDVTVDLDLDLAHRYAIVELSNEEVFATRGLRVDCRFVFSRLGIFSVAWLPNDRSRSN